MEVATTQQPANGYSADRMKSRDERKAEYLSKLKEQKGQSKRLAVHFLEKRDALRGLDREAREKRLRDIDLMIRYCEGDHYGDYDDDGTWKQATVRPYDFAYSVPVIEGHVEESFKRLMKTRPEYQINPKNKDDASRKQLAEMCQELALEEYDRLMTEDLRGDEVLNTIYAGESFRDLRWAVPVNPRMVTRTKYEESEETIPAWAECEACHREVPVGSEVCSDEDCGATFITEHEEETRKVQEAVGRQEIPLAENVLHIAHPTAIQYDLSAAKILESTFIVERDFLDPEVAEYAYQTKFDDADYGLTREMKYRHEQERASTQTDAFVGSSRHFHSSLTQGKKIQRERHFWDVTRYGSIYLSEEETLPDGRKLPANTFLGQHFPDGLYILFVGNRVMDVKPCRKSRRWVAVLYGKRGGSPTGKGMQSLIALNDIIDDATNSELKILDTVSHPLTAVWGKSVREWPQPGEYLRIDALPPGAEGRGIEGAIMQRPGQAAHPAVGAMAEKINAIAQFSQGTYTVGAGGAADQQNLGGTATEVVSRNEQANDRAIGPIGQRIFADREFLFQILENIRDYSAQEQKAELEKRFGPDTFKQFEGCNFRQELNVGVKTGTDTPRSQALTTANVFALAQAAQGLAQVPDGGQLLASMAETLGAPLSLGQGRNDRREAEYRINKLLAIAEMAEEEQPELVADSLQAAQKLYDALAKICGPEVFTEAVKSGVAGAEDVFIFLQDHDSFMDVYKDFLFGERAKTLSESVRLTVIRLWYDHFTAKEERGLKLAALQAQMQASLNPQPNPEDEQNKAVQEEAMSRQADEAQSDAEAERQDTLAERDHQRNVEMETVKAGNQIAIEKAKPQTNGKEAR